MDRVLSTAYLCSVAGRHTPGTLPPVAVHITPPGPDALRDASTLLRRSVTVTAAPHPTLDTLLRDAGAEVTHPKPGSTRYALTVRGPVSAEVTDAIAAIHPAAVRLTKGVTLPDVLGPGAAARVDDLHRGGRRGGKKAGMVAELARTPRQLTVTIRVAGHLLSDWGLDDRTHQVRLTPFQVRALLEDVEERRLVATTKVPSRLDELTRLTAGGTAITAAPGAPAMAVVVTGSALTRAPEHPMTAHEAVTYVPTPAHGPTARQPVRVAVAPDVIQAAAVHHALSRTPTPADGDQLHPWQRAFVDAYLASGPGLVNALPPGSGKTVCAAGAMAHRARTSPGSYRSVVLCPASLRTQWGRELGVFFPDTDVTVATAADHVHAWLTATDTGPTTLVLTPQLLTNTHTHDGWGNLTVGDLIVDEAVFLTATHTQHAQAAWVLRQRADHAMVLTGTPDQRGVAGVGQLLAFARNTPHLFTTHPLDGATTGELRTRVGHLVHAGHDGLTELLPGAAPVCVPCVPGDAEQIIDTEARRRIRDLLAAPKPSAIKVRQELEAWRLGLADPAALLDTRYGLADAVRDHVDPATAGVKSQWVSDHVASVAHAGQQVLVFCDFAGALAGVADQLRHAGVTHRTVSSATTAAGRDDAVIAFNSSEVQVLLLSSTGHLGLNLQSASVAVHLDVPNSAGELRQRAARAARLGNTRRNVDVRVPVLDGCGDQRLLGLIGDGGDADQGGIIARAELLLHRP